MTDPLLQSLRDRVLDESEPIAGLLRKCLLLGAETGSVALRDWARRELNGYKDEDDVPSYRKLGGLPIFISSVSGSFWSKGQAIHRLQIPAKAREFVPEEVLVRQAVEELEALARDKTIRLATPGMPMAAATWSAALDPFQDIIEMYHQIPGSVFAGIVGQIRTTLVDFIADLTADTPLTELPRREVVDKAFEARIGHVGDVITTTINHPKGSTAIGRGAEARTEGLSVADVLMLLGSVQGESEALAPDDKVDILTAVDELRDAIESAHPDGEGVKAKAGRLKELGARVGSAGLVAATSGVFEAVANLAAQGIFG